MTGAASKTLSPCKLPISVVLNPRDVLCRATAVSRRRQQWIRGVSNPPVLPGHPSRTLSGRLLTPRLSSSLSPPNTRAESLAKRGESPIGMPTRSQADRVFDSELRCAHHSGFDLSCRDRRGTGGGTQGGTPPSREVVPLDHRDLARIAVDANAVRRPTASDKFNQRRELLDARAGRRSVPPAKDDDAGEAIKRSSVA